MKCVHMIGIGGAGMSGLARLLVQKGAKVTGSDSGGAAALASEGVTVYTGHSAEQVGEGVEVVVYSPAVEEDNVERTEARRRGIPEKTYPEALADVLRGERLVTVVGTHGKTTTTGLLVAGMDAADEYPSFLVGAGLPQREGKNAALGKSDFFVLEACEYRRAFLQYSPEMVVVTSLEADHLDYYKDEEDYVAAFVQLVRKLPSHGMVIGFGDERLMGALKEVAPFFVDAGEYRSRVPEMVLRGEHNRRNAALALAALDMMGVNLDEAERGIAEFTGAERRMERRGTVNGAVVYDDYAHHPTEVAATLSGLREKEPGKRIIAVYQQHQVGRVRAFLPRLAESLRGADVVLIPDVYAVRESGADAEDAARELARAVGERAVYTAGQEGAAAWLRAEAGEGDVVLVMGAGSITQLARSVVEEGAGGKSEKGGSMNN